MTIFHKKEQLNPLLVIFEEHLFNFHRENSDRQTFVESVLQSYLSYLSKLNITVPKSLERPIHDELVHQIRSMLLKRIYGYHSIRDFQLQLTKDSKRKAHSRYLKLTAKVA